MSAVGIYDDPFEVIDSGDVIVRNQPDLLRAVEAIEEASASGADLCVLLRNPALGRSLLEHLEKLPSVHIEQLQPLRMLADGLGIQVDALPAPLREDPRFAVTSGLLASVDAVQQHLSSGPTAAIIATICGEQWAGQALPHDPAWVARLIVNISMNSEQSGTLQLMQVALLQDWAFRPSAHPALRALAGAQDLRQTASAFVCAAAVKDYDSRLRLLVGAILMEQVQDVGIDKRLLVELEGAWTHGPVNVPSSVVTEVDRYLESRLDSAGLDTVDGTIGGMLDVEAKVVERYMRRSGPLRTDEEAAARRIAKRLEIHGLSSGADAITSLIPPRRPSFTYGEQGWQDVKAQLTADYFPYYSWAAESGALGNLSDSVEGFERWLVREYEHFTWGSEAYAPLAVNGHLQRFLQSGIPVCLIVVDALSWNHSLHLQAQLNADGGLFMDLIPALAAVPTVTSVSKPAVVRGQKPDQLALEDISESDYKGLFAANAGLEENQVALMRSGAATLDDLLSTDADAYVYMYDGLDTLVHQALSPSMRTRNMKMMLQVLATDISLAREQYKLRTGRRLGLVVCSDHGYTELPADAETVVLSPDAHIDHARVGRASSAPKEVHEVREITRAPSAAGIFMASTWDYFGSRPKGAVHGGITPQEVVVPVGLIDPATEYADFRRLVVFSEGEVRRGRSANHVTLQVQNENLADVSLAAIAVRLCNVSTELPVVIPAGRAARLDATLDAGSVTSEELELTVDAKVNYIGEEQEQRTVLRMATSGAAVSDASFEDDFDL